MMGVMGGMALEWVPWDMEFRGLITPNLETSLELSLDLLRHEPQQLNWQN
jgi:hypothetical protein